VSAFRAPAWAWLLTAAALALFGTLGAWQVRRGIAKEAMLATLTDTAAPAERLAAASAPARGLELRRAEARGTYVADRQLLQDGQSLHQKPGYHVWTPLRLADGTVVIVNRGWVPLDRSGFDGGAPVGEVTVRGFWRSLPEPGMRLAAAAPCPPAPKFPAVVLYPTALELDCMLGQPVLPGLLLLDADVPGGFAREWTDFGFPPQRHYGYAVQWLALALVSLILFIAVNRKRSP
jgi:surfeit locus 1 family protein